jgi:GT2 family glycosyltransferase
MNIARPDKIVLLGFLSHFPVAGVAWQTLHYLIGLRRLGYDVYYVEAHGCTATKLMRHELDDDAVRAAEYISRIMGRFDLDGRWAYHARYPESRIFGMSPAQLNQLYGSAALIINLHGSHLPTPELAATNRLVYLETDPVAIEVDLFHNKAGTRDYLAPHCAFFTFGENLRRPDCLLPSPTEFHFQPTRQPVVMDFWGKDDCCEAKYFTTIGNWQQPGREITFKGEVYGWSKHDEFRKFLELPSRTSQPLELALSRFAEEDKQLLESKGWHVRQALEFSYDLDAYRRYITDSRGEFTVAKDQNVRLRSGWFSDRAVTYLAAGRPVITQDTGFGNILPTGQGLFAFSTIDEIVGAIKEINGDYARHRRSALAVAREWFSYDVVLKRLLQDVGVSAPGARPSSGAATSGRVQAQDSSRVGGPEDVAAPEDGRAPLLPRTLVLSPISRWPTRLAEESVKMALALPPVVAGDIQTATGRRASVIIVTCGGLHYTKMCLTSLLCNGWHQGDELIVVDNASPDGTPDYLRQLSAANPFIRVLFNQINRGFAAANNQGLAQATGEILILLNNDTLVPRGWREGLVGWLEDETIGIVGPVTNRAPNEAQIDAPYRTLGEMEEFAQSYCAEHRNQAGDIRMLALFCAAIRREVFEKVGPLDERFEVGMFEDDDYAMRVRQAGYRVVCTEDVFVHHFGQGTFGELCVTGDYNRVLEWNRARFEAKWQMAWQPHGRRVTEDYQRLRRRVRTRMAALPPGSAVAIVSKGDEVLLDSDGCRGWHFPQANDGSYANIYPADSAEAIAQLEALRAKGAAFLLFPKPAFWWLEHYREFKAYLESNYLPAVRDEETCLIFDLRHAFGGGRGTYYTIPLNPALSPLKGERENGSPALVTGSADAVS